MKPLVNMFVFSSKKTSVNIQWRAHACDVWTAELSASMRKRMYGGPVIGGLVRLSAINVDGMKVIRIRYAGKQMVYMS